MGPFDPESLIRTLGTIGIITVIFLECGMLLGLIFPGDSLLFTAGLFAATGKFGLNIGVVTLGVILAAIAGGQIGYWLGKKYGPGMFRRPDSRIFKQEYVQRSEEFFDKHGSKTIFLARFLPFVRTLVPPLAGIGNMDLRKYTTYNVVGGVVWAGGVTLAGYALGTRIPPDKVDTYLIPIVLVIIALSLIPPILEWRKHKREQNARVG
ncbi:MAG TPA: DedA family protein [Acidimicrobiia bacterium]|jgi:membrane-associated protein